MAGEWLGMLGAAVVASVVDMCSEDLDDESRVVDEVTLGGANAVAGDAASSAPVRERKALASFMMAGVS